MEFDLAPLRKLQEIDLAIAARLKVEDELPRQIQAFDDEISSRQAEMEGEKGKLGDLQKSKKTAEGEVELLRGKIAHYKDQLLSVKTNREYSALLKEIDSAQKKIDGLEETIIAYMIETDEHHAHLKRIEAWFQSERAKLLANKAGIERELAKARADRSALESQRLEMEKTLPETVYRTYVRVRELRGTSLAEARDQFCMECHVRLRPQVYNDLRSNIRMITCDSCDRILFYDGPPPVAQPDEAAAPMESEEELDAATQGRSSTGD
ncbi:MAG: hypothetical protein HYX75_10790 [Acidobacteria bacterium]|nr:hypothetical protein [Acidobacteriota bacterium]